MRISKLSKRFGPILEARFQVPFRIYNERQAIPANRSFGPEKVFGLSRNGPSDRTLGARGFSCAVSGVGHVSIVQCQRPKAAFPREKPLVPRVL